MSEKLLDNTTTSVGQLKRLLADLPDDMPLAQLNGFGGMWDIGMHVGVVDLVKVTGAGETIVVSPDDKVFGTSKHPRSEPFKALAIV